MAGEPSKGLRNAGRLHASFSLTTAMQGFIGEGDQDFATALIPLDDQSE